jgi:FtsH ternary system domain X5
MSRAYRICIRESASNVIRAEDHISIHLELLNILPPEQMAGLLASALEERGFQPEGEVLARKQNGVTVTVEPLSGTVTVRSVGSEEIHVEAETTGYALDEKGPSAKNVERALRKELDRAIKKKAESHKAGLQSTITARLEAQLGELRKELDQAVNRVTAEALKRKAAQLGTIKQVTEDPQSGSMTIVVEI